MCRFVAILSLAGGVIGDYQTNDLVVKNKEDMEFFRHATTEMGVVVMGRKTVESLPNKLKNRTTICLTRDEDYYSDKADVFLHTAEAVREFAHRMGKKEIAVCGGRETYELMGGMTDRVIITHFDQQPEIDHPVEAPDFIKGVVSRWPSVTIKTGKGYSIKDYTRPVYLSNPENILKYPKRYFVRNAIKTPDGTVLESKHRHDFQTHKDLNGSEYFVDGGLTMPRYGGGHLDVEDLNVHTDSHLLARHYLMWTTAEGVTRPVKELDTAHIAAILETQTNIMPQMGLCLKFELLYRLTMG